MQSQGLLFGEPADPDTLGPSLSGELDRRRAQFIRLAITRPEKPCDGISPLQAAVLQRVLTEAVAPNPAARPWCLYNWAVALALRNVFLAPRSEAAFQPLLSELLFVADKSGKSLLNELSFNLHTDTDGSIHIPGAAVCLRWTGNTPSSIHWRCGRRSAEVTDPLSGRSATIPLPLTSAQAESVVAVAPYPRIPRLDIAVLSRTAAEACGLGTLPSYPPNSSSALTLVDSVDAASRLLGRIWPERLAWTKALASALIDLGVTDGDNHRLSGSFEPGMPIYFSRVNEPFSHAEDLVHEVQHLRFPLTVPAQEWFGRWTDLACDYTSPYRSDPRPLQGVHLGLHAFVAVTELRLRTLDLGLQAPFSMRDLVDTHLRNLYACATVLAHEKISAEGRRYYRDIAERLSEQDRRIRNCLAPAGQNVDAEALRSTFITERWAHRTLNAAIEFGAQQPVDLLARCAG